MEATRVSSIHDKETAPVKSQQHSFLNKTSTMTASFNFFFLAFTVLTGAICNSDLFNIEHSWILNFSCDWSLCYKDLRGHLNFCTVMVRGRHKLHCSWRGRPSGNTDYSLTNNISLFRLELVEIWDFRKGDLPVLFILSLSLLFNKSFIYCLLVHLLIWKFIFEFYQSLFHNGNLIFIIIVIYIYL